MKKLILIMLMAGALRPVYSQQTTTEKLDELLLASTHANRFSGSVLVSKKGKILLYKGYGWKDVGDSLLNDTATVYQIASVTKEFTSAIILRLAEMKELSLNDKVSKFYPGFRKGDSITIENLLTHTSGINDQLYDGPSSASQEDLLSFVGKTNLAFAPGTQFKYSNGGYQLLGFIIQKVTGMTYYQVVRKYIFTPLKMTSSGFDFVHLVGKDKAIGYDYLSDTACPPAPIVDSTASFSAGSIYSTIGDLYKWLEGIGSYQVINKASLEKAYTPSVNPHYGYGRQIDTFFDKKVISHGGDIWGFKSYIANIPEDDVCIVLLENKEDADDINYLAQKIMAILYRQPYDLPAKNVVKLSPEVLRKYIGWYEMPPGIQFEVTLEHTHLIMTAPRKQEIFALKENLFILDDGYHQKQIEFEVDNGGKVTGLSFYKNEQKVICKKVR